ncbi:uncharacterized protein PHALS_13094 [Plasmopara halstedii]|uniref:Uncharacterized protein n=1 Tax=Plasmopara halstedii TaxID=4781 RepID=A0A0P1APT1_PLAHL|nr:uncharacterized protein PHALS_13094 [Plasmopara halstedii]CEG42854.1 hypothetical protein PHALS_13094 [Plasmopara halstedii]|eukprot:XP_024579223.1 hypothetical protein PHALS_13094 [Plasmopara halstedii]
MARSLIALLNTTDLSITGGGVALEAFVLLERIPCDSYTGVYNVEWVLVVVVMDDVPFLEIIRSSSVSPTSSIKLIGGDGE